MTKDGTHFVQTYNKRAVLCQCRYVTALKTVHSPHTRKPTTKLMLQKYAKYR